MVDVRLDAVLEGVKSNYVRVRWAIVDMVAVVFGIGLVDFAAMGTSRHSSS